MKPSTAFGLLYFVMVFIAGFALAPVRELVLAPKIGPLWAELAEMPVMLAVLIWVSGWIARRRVLAGQGDRLLTVGSVALALMLLAEYGVVRLVRQISLAEYIAGREVLPGLIYVAMLLLMVVLPWLHDKRRSG